MCFGFSIKGASSCLTQGICIRLFQSLWKCFQQFQQFFVRFLLTLAVACGLWDYFGCNRLLSCNGNHWDEVFDVTFNDSFPFFWSSGSSQLTTTIRKNQAHGIVVPTTALTENLQRSAPIDECLFPLNGFVLVILRPWCHSRSQSPESCRTFVQSSITPRGWSHHVWRCSTVDHVHSVLGTNRQSLHGSPRRNITSEEVCIVDILSCPLILKSCFWSLCALCLATVVRAEFSGFDCLLGWHSEMDVCPWTWLDPKFGERIWRSTMCDHARSHLRLVFAHFGISLFKATVLYCPLRIIWSLRLLTSSSHLPGRSFAKSRWLWLILQKKYFLHFSFSGFEDDPLFFASGRMDYLFPSCSRWSWNSDNAVDAKSRNLCHGDKLRSRSQNTVMCHPFQTDCFRFFWHAAYLQNFFWWQDSLIFVLGHLLSSRKCVRVSFAIPLNDPFDVHDLYSLLFSSRYFAG